VESGERPLPGRAALAAVPNAPAGGHPFSPRRAFGHTADRRGVIEEEAVAIRDAALRVLGGETLSAIVQEWNRRGLTTSNGGPWRVNSLSSLLVQGRLAGLSNDPAHQAAGTLPAILDLEIHSRLLALHAERRKGPRRPTRRYLLTGLLRCWRCGGGLRGMPRSRGADLYVCPGPPHGGCSGTAVTADHADDAIREMVLARLDSAELAGVIASQGRAASSHQASVRRSAGELASHRQRLDDLADMWASGEITRAEWLSLKRNVGGRTKLAEAEAARLARVEALRVLAGTGRALRRQWPDMSVEERRRVLHAAVDHVVVLAAEPPRQVFRAERLRPRWLD